VITNGSGKPVVAIDLDGTLGDYHGNFVTFARLYFDYGPAAWTMPNPGLPMWEWMGLSERDYRDAKLAYRQGGWKRWMPCYPGAMELTMAIRGAGAELWLCTTRPYLRLDNVDPDTREWLRRNMLEYDALLFDPAHEEDGTKYHELVRQVGADRIASVVDDLPEMLNAAEDLRIPKLMQPIVRDQPYNQHLELPLRRARSCADIWDFVSDDLQRWRAENYG
jgi:hypothetical protein